MAIESKNEKVSTHNIKNDGKLSNQAYSGLINYKSKGLKIL